MTCKNRIDDMAEDLGPVQGARPLLDAGSRAVHAPPPASAAGKVLLDMMLTAEGRNADYKDNWRMIVKLLAVLFPNGVPPELIMCNSFHLFMQILGKLSRFASTNCTHIDSIHDIGPYAALCEVALREEQSHATES